MPENFLRKSPEYVRISNLPSTKHNYLKLADEVLRYLNNDFVCKNGKSWRQIAREFNDKGFSISSETLRRVAMQIYYTATWLKGTDDERAIILSEIRRKSPSYANFVRKGIDCMIKDGFVSWESIENPKGINRFEIFEVDPEPLGFNEALGQIRELHQNLKDQLKEKEAELIECLDEIKRLSVIAQVSQNRLEEIERLKPFEEKCKKLEKKVLEFETERSDK